jgi:hypothetical protein
MTKYLTPEKYEALSDKDKKGWQPQYKEYSTTIIQQMQYCDCCGHELGLEDVTVKKPIGTPYRWAWTIESSLIAYYEDRLLEQADKSIIYNKPGKRNLKSDE